VSNGWDPGATDKPRPPSNVTVVSPFVPGVLDVRWDDPSILGGNTVYTVVGVNVYRSDVSDRGPYFRLNKAPVGGTFYRDRTELVLVDREPINWANSWVFKGNKPNELMWKLRTQHPISKMEDAAPYQQVTAANAPTDVEVFINGTQVPVEAVFGPSGEVTLVNIPQFNVVTETYDPSLAAALTATDVVEVSYYTKTNHVRSGLGSKIFYRVTTVATDATTLSGYVESDLEQCEPANNVQVERMDYIWREAVRRNHWILQQGGERVKIFIRKTSGEPCDCTIDPQLRDYSQQPSNRCEVCYGTGYVGGYEGPFDTIIAPDDAERRVTQSERGRHVEHTYEVFMGPSPVVTQRDFIVKQTNERYSIGPSRRPTNRGNLLQQHFNIRYLDEGDIKYKVPIDGVDTLTWPETRYGFRPYPFLSVDGEGYTPPSTAPDAPPYPEGPDAQIPMETDKAGWDKSKEQRGRTPVWENQNE